MGERAKPAKKPKPERVWVVVDPNGNIIRVFELSQGDCGFQGCGTRRLAISEFCRPRKWNTFAALGYSVRRATLMLEPTKGGA